MLIVAVYQSESFMVCVIRSWRGLQRIWRNIFLISPSRVVQSLLGVPRRRPAVDFFPSCVSFKRAGSSISFPNLWQKQNSVLSRVTGGLVLKKSVELRPPRFPRLLLATPVL